MRTKKNPKARVTLVKPSRVKKHPSTLDKVRAKTKAVGLTEKDIDEAVRWARDR